ncbi:hypothetical protein TR51_02440 [Kitasatospora griseola]|uniref:Uncharacterized protein n=1 Tax=Kitasatospora griseola TaxID=2064 RepID=A0A0D0PVD9_KITGR|nr:hypothetical protein [Kitasatospora griseola]KIQ66474.1 hypothetical protein TR51_02440 [Kitasatospora griseola]
MINEYHPLFTHQDWIDNEDRVQAGGEKGLNIRFHNLEAEFRTIADDHVNPVIDKIAEQRGRFLHPTVFDQPAERGIGVPPAPVRNDASKER